MKIPCYLVMLLIAVALCSRLSLAASESSGVPSGDSSLARELRGLIAKAGDFFSSVSPAGADGWHSEVDASARSLKRLKKASVNCISAGMCRRKKVLCGKRCYRSRAAGAGLNHIPSNRCVVRCKKCVPTC